MPEKEKMYAKAALEIKQKQSDQLWGAVIRDDIHFEQSMKNSIVYIPGFTQPQHIPK